MHQFLLVHSLSRWRQHIIEEMSMPPLIGRPSEITKKASPRFRENLGLAHHLGEESIYCCDDCDVFGSVGVMASGRTRGRDRSSSRIG
jgi:hypothetical protein